MQIAAELMKLLGGRLSAVMLLAVLNGSLGFLCAMGVPFSVLLVSQKRWVRVSQ